MKSFSLNLILNNIFIIICRYKNKIHNVKKNCYLKNSAKILTWSARKFEKSVRRTRLFSRINKPFLLIIIIIYFKLKGFELKKYMLNDFKFKMFPIVWNCMISNSYLLKLDKLILKMLFQISFEIKLYYI